MAGAMRIGNTIIYGVFPGWMAQLVLADKGAGRHAPFWFFSIFDKRSLHGLDLYIILYISQLVMRRSSMDVMTYSDARSQLKGVMDRAINDKEEIVVTRRNGEAVVVVSLESWNAITETLYLLSSPRNAARLRASVAQLGEGLGKERELIE